MPGQHEPLTDAMVEPGFNGRNPFPHYARMRAEAPVAWNATQGFWALSRFAEVHEVSTDPDRFCSGKGILTMEIGLEYDSPPTMMHTDPPEHTAYRKLVQPGFKPSLMKALVPVARDRLLDLFDRVQDGEPVDFVQAVSVPFPLRIIGDLLGLPDDGLGGLLLLVRGDDRAPSTSPPRSAPRSRATCGPTSSRSSAGSGPSPGRT